MSGMNGNCVKKDEKFSSHLEHKLAFYLGVTGVIPEDKRAGKAVMISDKNCDTKYLGSIAKNHIFGDFYDMVVKVAFKYGNTEQEKQEYFKKLLNLLSSEALSYSQEVDRIEGFKRERRRLASYSA